MVADLPKKRRRHFLKEKEMKKLLLEVTNKLGLNVERLLGLKPRVELNEIETIELFIFNGRPLIARSNDTLFPTLTFQEFFPFIPKIVVDMGAVPYVCKGADIMTPGVVAIQGDFKAGDLLLVVDERHNKPLAVGVALLDSEVIKAASHGKSVRNLHYVGDKVWTHLKTS
jgi:PUA-domain protein